MKAVVKTQPGHGHVELIDMPEPDAGPGQVVIEIRAAGICGTDIHIYHGDYLLKPPVILGHEFAGQVVAVGPGVTRCHVGDRVTVNPSAGRLCGDCRYCRIGAPFFCVDRAALGSGMHGAFARHCGVRQEVVYQLPENLDYDIGALCEPFACSLQAVIELTEIKPSEVVVISGPGPIGLLCMMLAKTHGARVVMLGTSADDKRMALAGQLGAEITINVEVDNAREIISDLTDGYGAGVVIECAGVEASANQCLDVVKALGCYTQVGLFGTPVKINLDQVVIKQLRMQGSMCHTWDTWERTLSFLAQNLIDLSPLISEILPLSRWEEGFEKVMNKEAIKILLHPDE